MRISGAEITDDLVARDRRSLYKDEDIRLCPVGRDIDVSLALEEALEGSRAEVRSRFSDETGCPVGR